MTWGLILIPPRYRGITSGFITGKRPGPSPTLAAASPHPQDTPYPRWPAGRSAPRAGRSPAASHTSAVPSHAPRPIQNTLLERLPLLPSQHPPPGPSACHFITRTQDTPAGTPPHASAVSQVSLGSSPGQPWSTRLPGLSCTPLCPPQPAHHPRAQAGNAAAPPHASAAPSPTRQPHHHFRISHPPRFHSPTASAASPQASAVSRPRAARQPSHPLAGYHSLAATT